MDKKTSPALRLVTVNSDKSFVVDATRTVSLVNPDTGRYLDGVTATLKLIEPERYKAIEEKHRSAEKTPRGVEWKIDTDAVILEVLAESVESWAGVVGADGKPMPVCGPALKALDSMNRVHLAGIARTPAEIVDAEVVAASFRESPGVDRVDRRGR